MYREINIGEKSVLMKATAATALRYRHVFGQDLLTEMQKVGEDGGLGMSALQQLAFIMASAADPKVDMRKLNDEEYIDWLDNFEPLDFAAAAEDIIDLYIANTKGLSEIKKKAGDAVNEN